jgi:branched-chain amino acid transport system substrate-binding protein
MRTKPLVLFIVALSAAPGCKPQGSAPENRSSIVIGATLPLTGSEARVGGFYKEGYDLAFEEVNQHGGLQVGGRKLPVTLKLLDDTTTQATAVSLADRFVTNDKVDFLLGTYQTPLVQAQSTVAEQNKFPYVNGGGAATEIYRRGYKYVFGILAPVELLGKTLMAWIDEQQQAGKLPKPAKIALVWENTSHGKDFAKGVSEAAQKSGGYQIVVNESFELGGKDFGALLGKIKAAQADIFLADAHLPDYITMHRQYLQNGLHHQMVSYGARGPEAGARQALGAGTDYIFAGIWWSNKLPYPQAKKFAADYKAFTGHDVDSWYAAPAYDGMRIVAQAIEAAGSLDKTAIRDALKKAQLKDSVLPGQVLKFGANGQTEYPFVITQNKPDNKVDIVFPKDAATGEPVAPSPAK